MVLCEGVIVVILEINVSQDLEAQCGSDLRINDVRSHLTVRG